MGEAVAVATVGIAGGSEYKANQRRDMANRRMSRAQRRANEVEKRKAEIANARQIERAAETARISRAENTANQAAMGGSSSAMAGSNAAAMSSYYGNVGFSYTELGATTLKNKYLQKGQDQYNVLMNQANNWQSVGNLAGKAGSTFGGVG